MNQTSIFDLMYEKYKITKPIRLIECFAGYGSQALALKYLGVPFEHWKICEWAVKSIQAYKDIHFPVSDINLNSERTKEEMVDFLYKKGISANYNEPMTKEQIQRLDEKQIKTIIKNIAITHNLVNIQQVKGKDLDIKETDKYDYILTYSFPCQDLSLAGRKMGMSDTSTRSGMLWEIERILTECYELKTLPQVLLMENVPQVHSQDNIADFHKWQLRLEELGYKNYMQDLIATDYGIPQTRNRCFMISILGDYSYSFPAPIPLDKKLKDLLEDNVDEKYYLSDKMKKYIFSEDDSYKVGLGNLKLNRDIACSKTTREGNARADTSDYICDELPENFNIRGINNQNLNDEMKKINYVCDELIEKDKIKENDTILTNYITRRVKENDIIQNNNITPTLTTSATEIGVAVTQTTDLRIRKLTPNECFRLMGVKDEDFKHCERNQSNASLYHLAGDSIVVNVLMAIFRELV